MFKPNAFCSVSRMSEDYDIHGRQQEHVVYRRVSCGVVSLMASRQKSSVRADSSASRGAVDERVADSKILFLPGVDIRIGDKVDIHDFSLQVTGLHPRYNMAGRMDHLEVDLAVTK
jgi:hypothetical protein